MSLVNVTLNACKNIKTPRTKSDVLVHLMTEIGELAQEIQILEGKSYKVEGADGVVGEAVDAIVCLLDIINSVNDNITEDQLVNIATVKLNKWKSTAK